MSGTRALKVFAGFSPRASAFPTALGGWRLGGLRRLGGWRLGGGRGRSKADEDGGKKKKTRAKFRIDNLADMNELRRTGGKLFEAADHLSPAEDSPHFPTVTGHTLSGHTVTLPGNLGGNVALVKISMRAYGMHHCEQYSSPYMDSFGGRPDAAIFELSVVDVWVYRLLSRWMASNLRQTLSPDRHDWFMLYTGGGVARMRETLQLANSIVGYVFLLDQGGRIRWRALGLPTQTEVAALLNCTSQLLDAK